jgi:putative phosphoribosyl transferase
MPTRAGERDLPFRDRCEAGRILAEQLQHYAGRADVIVLGLPRGGVPVAFEVARKLRAPLEVFVVRKLGVPGYEELAMGAIASGGVRVLNDQVVRQLPQPGRIIEEVTAQEMRELQRREAAYRDGRAPLELRGKTVILVDDGLATGATMRAAVTALRRREVAAIVVGVPVAAPDTCADFRHEVDEIVCVTTPARFDGVGQFYEDFSQTTDEEVRELLARAAAAEETK